MTVASAINFLWFWFFLLPRCADPFFQDDGPESLLDRCIWHLLRFILFPVLLIHIFARLVCLKFVRAFFSGFKRLSNTIVQEHYPDMPNIASGPGIRNTPKVEEVLSFIR